MFELFQTAISPHQILFSLLLALVILYWLLVILGALDFESDIPGTDIDVDASGDGNPSHHHELSTGGVWLTAGRIIGFSRVPIVIWLSFMIVFSWLFSLAFNEWFNADRQIAQTLLLLLPNLVTSIFMTKLATLPISKMLQAMADAQNDGERVIGRTGIVVSVDVSEATGQIEISALGAPLLINARTRPDQPPLAKGTAVKVTASGPDHAFYFIEPLES